MAFDEKPDSRSWSYDPPEETRIYTASGVTATAIKMQAPALTPAQIIFPIGGTLFRQNIEIDELGHKVFECTVPYGPRPMEDWQFDFNTMGGTLHIKASRFATVRAYDATGVIAADNKQIIGDRGGGEVDGTDIIIPALKMTYTYTNPLGAVTEAYVRTLATITGATNNATFRGYNEGELLFLGARGSDGRQTEARVGYEFAASQNVAGMTIGDIAGIAKKGWEYLWLKWEDDEAAGEGIQKPKRVYIEQIYEKIDFSTNFPWLT